MKFNELANPENVALFKLVLYEIEWGRENGKLTEREVNGATEQAERVMFDHSTDGLDTMLARLRFRNYR